jgi:hypothetical protein
MATASGTNQTITRLTPLADVLSIIDTDVKPETPRTLALGRRGAWSLATPVPDDSGHVLWLAVSHEASQGLAWALLGATARQLSGVGCGGAPNG